MRIGVVCLSCHELFGLESRGPILVNSLCVCARLVGLLVVEFGCVDSVPCTLCVASCGRKNIYIYIYVIMHVQLQQVDLTHTYPYM